MSTAYLPSGKPYASGRQGPAQYKNTSLPLAPTGGSTNHADLLALWWEVGEIVGGKLKPRQASIPENYIYLHQSHGQVVVVRPGASHGRQPWAGSQEAFLEEEAEL